MRLPVLAGMLIPGLMMSSIALHAAGNEANFQTEPAARYAHHQTIEGVTIGVKGYQSEADAHLAFGKANPNDHGILPVLVVLQNDTAKAISLERLDVKLTFANGATLSPTPADDLPYLKGPKRPSNNPTVGLPIPLPKRGKKGPLGEPSIQTRAFGAKLMPPQDGVSGFFYFQTGFRPGLTLQVSGMRETATGKELFYFEVPVE